MHVPVAEGYISTGTGFDAVDADTTSAQPTTDAPYVENIDIDEEGIQEIPLPTTERICSPMVETIWGSEGERSRSSSVR